MSSDLLPLGCKGMMMMMMVVVVMVLMMMVVVMMMVKIMMMMMMKMMKIIRMVDFAPFLVDLTTQKCGLNNLVLT